MGAALLAGTAARASGVWMLSIAVPESLRLLLISHLPDALIIGCPETETGAIAHLPQSYPFDRYDAIACGCGLTIQASAAVEQVLASDRPLVLDADGLNIVASHPSGAAETLRDRSAPTILTPHWGEFKRLFPDLASESDRFNVVQAAAQHSQAIVLLKGARIIIAHPQGQLWLNPDSTPALARGGSGDILTGLLGGLLAQGIRRDTAVEAIVQSAAWWHSQAGILAAQSRTELGVDAATLSEYLVPALAQAMVSL
jgi:ADP-dependent NAD(P)H-hydrate dehydratase / NAD(P)H-hydrate epimerase